jgi:DNA-binding CsgD family transcriptional regulator
MTTWGVEDITPLGECSATGAGSSFASMQALRDPSLITDRQREVIELIAQGLSNDELSVVLGVSPRTVKAHCDVLRYKLGVKRRRHIPLAYRLMTGEDPLARSLELAKADDGG